MVYKSGFFFFLYMILAFACYKQAVRNYRLLQYWPGCNDATPVQKTLGGPCSKYSTKTCCNSTVSKLIGERVNHKNMRFDFCGSELSPSCRNYFENHFCLESCDPFMMPYYNSIRKNFYQVPLCESVCKGWFSACAQELFCARNLIIQYKWQMNDTLGRYVNNCFKGAECRRVDKIYSDHVDFCETALNGFYKVHNDRSCVVLDFKPEDNNPNSSLYSPRIIFVLSLIATLLLIPLAIYRLYAITQSSF